MGVLSGPWTWKRFRSFVYLAIAFNRRQLRRVFRGRKDDGGVARFLENFAHEGFAPLDAQQTELIFSLSKCIYCGVCEAVCPMPVDRWPAWSRALELARFAAEDLPANCEVGCRKCEALCPVGVPLQAIPAFVRRRTADATPR